MFVSAVCTGVFNPSPITSCDVAQGNTVGRLHLRILRFSSNWMVEAVPPTPQRFSKPPPQDEPYG
jgi:hypothetical protein